MKTRWVGGWAAIVIGATATAGSIDVGTPLISGELSRFADHRETDRVSLSADQLQALSTWLEHHRSGWQGMLTEASTHPGQLEWILKHRDGATTHIDVMAALTKIAGAG